MERVSLEWLNMRSRSLAVLVVVALMMPLIPISNAQNPIFGVQLDCADLPELDVSPSGYEPIDVICTIDNTAAVGATKVEITSEWSGGSGASMIGATGEYSIDAGGSEEFTVTFTGDTKQASSNSYAFEIFATVTEWNAIPMNDPFPQENDSYADTLQIASYGAVELEVVALTDTVPAGFDFVIDVQFTNNGNDADNIRVDIVNLNNLKNQGFSFIGSEFISEQLAPGATSSPRQFNILAPSDTDGDLNIDLQFRASSTADPNAEFSETNIPFTVESTKSSGSLTDGISEVGQDDIILYGAIAGGVILLLLLLGVVRRSVKKKKAKIDEATPIELDADDDDDQEVDEFDDLFDDLDDFVIESDEFDDLLDDF